MHTTQAARPEHEAAYRHFETKAMRRLSFATLIEAITDCRDGAVFAQAMSDRPDQKHPAAQRRRAEAWNLSVEWINGAPSPLRFALVANLIGYDEVELRRRLAAYHGFRTCGPQKLIVGPFTRDHAERAAELAKQLQQKMGGHHVSGSAN